MKMVRAMNPTAPTTAKWVRAAATCIGLALPLLGAHAQQSDFPGHAARVEVGFAAGGPTDTVARLVARHLNEDLKQSFIVDNRPGAAGNIATAEVVKAAPDGYTSLIASVNITINPAVMDDIRFDGRTDLKAVKSVAKAPTVLVVRNDFPARNYAEFIAELRKHPDKYNSAAPGASPLLATELFDQLTKTHITPVPYKGAAPAMVDLVAGQVDLSFATLGSVLPHIKAGKVRALAIASPQRDPQLPDVPTFAESGLPNFRFDAWVGLFVPARTPDAVIAKLDGSLDKLVKSKAYASQLALVGMTPVMDSTPASFAATIDQETTLYAHLGQALKDKALVPK
jgi:tripartite-type tricarboxylate transporter receptor subunit TctC